MANSSFYNMVVPGSKNGGNAATLNAIDSAKLPFCFAPKLVYEQTITWKDLRDATGVVQIDEMVVTVDTAGVYAVTFTNMRTGAEIVTLEHTVHEDTITIGGTASDGNYETFFPTPNGIVRVRTVRSTTPATNANIATQHAADITDLVASSLAGVVASASANSNVVTVVYEAGIDPVDLTTNETTATGTITATVGEDQDDIAAALEALIEADRGSGALADYLDDESVSTDTITLDWLEGAQVRMEADFPGTATGTVTTTNVATITLGSAGNYFPANVWVDGAIANVVTLFDEGGSPTITLEVGDAGDPNGLMTASDMTTTGVYETTGAAEFTRHMETAFAPTVTVTGDILFGDLTQGEVSVMVRYIPPPGI